MGKSILFIPVLKHAAEIRARQGVDAAEIPVSVITVLLLL